MYSKLAVTPIDEHKYSKCKYLEWSVQAALSYANGTLIHILMPIYKLSNSNQTQGQFSDADRNYFTLCQGQPEFYSSAAFCAREHIKRMGCLESSFTMTSSNYFLSTVLDITPEGWRPHTLQFLTPYSPSLANFTRLLARGAFQHRPPSAFVLHKLAAEQERTSASSWAMQGSRAARLSVPTLRHVQNRRQYKVLNVPEA